MRSATVPSRSMSKRPATHRDDGKFPRRRARPHATPKGADTAICKATGKSILAGEFGRAAAGDSRAPQTACGVLPDGQVRPTGSIPGKADEICKLGAEAGRRCANRPALAAFARLVRLCPPFFGEPAVVKRTMASRIQKMQNIEGHLSSALSMNPEPLMNLPTPHPPSRGRYGGTSPSPFPVEGRGGGESQTGKQGFIARSSVSGEFSPQRRRGRRNGPFRPFVG